METKDEASRSVREYLSVLHDTAFGAASPVTPKFISPSDAAAQWTGAHKGHAFFAYSTNYLIDTDHGVILGVEATRAVRQAGTGNGELINRANLHLQRWIMREVGSGTRSALEAALQEIGISTSNIEIGLVLPSNEAVLSAVRSGGCVTALSETIVMPFIENGQLRAVDIELPPRRFTLLRHKERHLTAPAREFEAFCRAHV